MLIAWGSRPSRGAGGDEALAEFEGRSELRRAREAALLYERRSEALLAASPGGFLTLFGSQAADGYEGWARRDAEARAECGAGLGRGGGALYLALTGKTSANAVRLASAWAARQGREAHAALIERELVRLGEESASGASTLAGRAALIEAARPAVSRLAEELASALGLPRGELPALFSAAMARVARAAVERAAAVDPLAGAALAGAAGGYLPPSTASELAGMLKGQVARALALNAASEATTRAGSREVTFHLIDEMALPEAVEADAKAFAASELLCRERSRRLAEIDAEGEARRLLAHPGAALADLPEPLWSALSARSRGELSTGAARATDARTFAALAAAAVGKPGEFAGFDLSPYFYRLSYADYALLADYAERLKTEPEARPPQRVAEAAARSAPSPSLSAKPSPELVDAMGRHLAKLTGRRPTARVCEMAAFAAGLSHAGLLDHRAGCAVLKELVTDFKWRSAR